MSSINKATLLGNLGNDPEIRTTSDGRKIANFSVATQQSWKDKATGEKKEKVHWHRVVCFSDGLSGIIEQYCKKGSKVYVEGSMQTRKWTDKEGIERYSTEVVMQGFDAKLILLGGKGEKRGASEGDYGSDAKPSSEPKSAKQEMDDEIPF